MRKLPHSWFADDAVTLAPKLLGKIIRKGSCAGIIVETEAYTIDPASHGARITKKSAAMRDTYGHWYVYFTYGMHYCANITTNKNSIGAVLIRAVEPIEGLPLMKRRRAKSLEKSNMGESNSPKSRVGKLDSPTSLCSGPAKFCQAFGIDKRQNGVPIAGDFAIYYAPDLALKEISVSERIGITKGIELPWRFYIRDNPFVSGTRKNNTS